MRKHLVIAAFAIAAALAGPTGAEAKIHHRPHIHHRHSHAAEASHRRAAIRMARRSHPSRKTNLRASLGQTVAHPPGCPWIRFCGCGVSVRVFGHAVRDLFLAVNWRRFAPAAPAPGMVAWRRGHVFLIEEAYGDGTVLAWDPNSGGHQTRVHRRSLAGFRVVNPHVRAS